jgi:hypothetical protein
MHRSAHLPCSPSSTFIYSTKSNKRSSLLSRSSETRGRTDGLHTKRGDSNMKKGGALLGSKHDLMMYLLENNTNRKSEML